MIVREITLSDLDPLIKLVESDKHAVVRPTHIIARDNNEIIGYVSAAAVPTFGVWMHTKRAKARESLKVELFCEELARSRGAPIICMPCAIDSPFWKYMPRLGFTSFGRMDMFIKSV